MQENNRPKWLIPVGIGCAVIICLCLVGVGALYIFGDQLVEQLYPSNLGDFDDFLDTGDLPQPPVEPPLENPAPGGSQISDQTDFFDDFSSQALDWAIVNDGMTVLKYENQAYSLEIYEPSYLDGVRIPTLFDPTEVKFDVWGRPGEQQGSVGLECRIQLGADDNLNAYYYVEIDLYYQDLIIGGYMNSDYVSFYDETENQGFLPLSNMNPPEQTNTVEVICLPDVVKVSINGVQQYEILIPQEHIINENGPMTLVMYTYEEASNGYKVYFDNVYAWP